MCCMTLVAQETTMATQLTRVLRTSRTVADGRAQDLAPELGRDQLRTEIVSSLCAGVVIGTAERRVCSHV